MKLHFCKIRRAYVATFTVIPLGLFVLCPGSAWAVRSIFFETRATNTTLSTSLPQTQQANCTISITNPSSYTQIFSLSFSSGDGAAGSADAGNPATDTTLNGLAATTLTAGSTKVYSYQYTSVNAGSGPTTQNVVCKGWIFVDDASTSQRGFLTASGVIMSFFETGGSVDTGAYGGAWHLNPRMTFSPVPVLIEGGRPF